MENRPLSTKPGTLSVEGCTGWIVCVRVCVCMCVSVVGVGVREQRRKSKWKGFPELRGIKVADGFSDLSFSIFVRKLKVINSYLTAEPFVPSIESLSDTSQLLVGEWCTMCAFEVLFETVPPPEQTALGTWCNITAKVLDRLKLWPILKFRGSPKWEQTIPLGTWMCVLLPQLVLLKK